MRRVTYVCLCDYAAYFSYMDRIPIDAPTLEQAVTPICREDKDTNPLPRPIFGLPCRDSCYDGEFATIDLDTMEMVCDPCPSNMYSIGNGGIRIDGTMGAFSRMGDDGSRMPLRMSQSCKITSPGYEELKKNEGCTPWTITGTSLKAYQSSYSGVTVDFDVTWPVYFDDVGSVEFKYRKDTIATDTHAYGVFKFIIDDQIEVLDNKVFHSDWQVQTVDGIPPGFHMLTWRYSKYNSIPFTEFMESEIEYILVKGRHSDKLTECYPCRLGMSTRGADRCELCAPNNYFYINKDNGDYYCAQCPENTFSAEGSVGVGMCKPKRPCDDADIEITFSECDEDGMRQLTYAWADHDGDGQKDCDPYHEKSLFKDLPTPMEESCDACTKGMSRDKNGNCKMCPSGEFQPEHLDQDLILDADGEMIGYNDDNEDLTVNCTPCQAGTFANQVLDIKEFDVMPEFLTMQKCSSVTPHTSQRLCQTKQRRWRNNGDALKLDTGLVPGLRVSVGGNVTISNDLGGMIIIEYNVAKFRDSESFKVFIDSFLVSGYHPGSDRDEEGLTRAETRTITYQLAKGVHMIQFSGESRIDTGPIDSFWDSQALIHKVEFGEDSLAEIEITRITFEGISNGGAFEC